MKMAKSLRTIGGEVGVTTGRATVVAVGIDAPIARYAVRVNGLTDFFLTKLDVLSTVGEDSCMCCLRS
jgi:adenylosuccinate synthase